MGSNKISWTARELGHFLEPIGNPKSGDCRCCKMSVLGIPAYKCLDCEFVIHKSCLEAKEKTEMEVHESGEGHHLFETKITAMKLHDDDEKKAVCSMCKETEPHLSDKNAPLIYRCFIPNCNYFIHKSCAEAPDNMQAKHLHDHMLFLKPPTENRHCCGACAKHFIGSFFYDCDTCEYEMDIKCIYRREVSPDECKPHLFIHIPRQIEFPCQVCGEKRSDMGFICSNCRFLIHSDCARYPRNIKVRGHDHSLTITQPLSQHQCQGSHICQLCGENMNKDHGAYCCKQALCGFIAHLSCAYFEEDQTGTSGSAIYRNLFVEEEKEELIREKKPRSRLHRHELTLMEEEPKGKSCAVCMRPILIPQFYGCKECPFFVHTKCAQLPEEIDRPIIHEHRLRLRTPSDNFWCWECDRRRNGFFYTSNECGWYEFDIQCALIPDAFNHKLHKHRLFRGSRWGPKCRACGEDPWWARTIKCKTCNFWLCIKCATLPLVATHKYDKHLLGLTNKLKENPDECYCQICEEKLDENHWFYYCQVCDFISHSKCILEKN